MMSSHSRILANLSSKENMSPRRKVGSRSSEEAFSSTNPENASKRRTVDSFMLPKTKSLFSSKSTNKGAIKKQTSIKNYYKEGLKEKSENVMTIFDENNKNTKKKTSNKEDDAFSMMCSEEAPEKYWELLAEERRKGLESALKENKELADEIRAKDETILELRTEVSELKETAKHAEYLATVLEELGKESNVAVSEDESSDDETDEENEVFDEKDISVSYPTQSDDADKENEKSEPSDENDPPILDPELNLDENKDIESEGLPESQQALDEKVDMPKELDPSVSNPGQNFDDNKDIDQRLPPKSQQASSETLDIPKELDQNYESDAECSVKTNSNLSPDNDSESGGEAIPDSL
uniref:geminin-like isoform X1 n=1 Tax=Styela clava TaxID=7725 RepID=UPI001939D6F0|nr:geminin-like isoform X1 [Styela clava]